MLTVSDPILLNLGSTIRFSSTASIESLFHGFTQIHNEIKFMTLVYRCDHKVTHCTDSVIKSSSTLLFPMISLYEAFWRDYDIDQISPSKNFMDATTVYRCDTYPNVTTQYICSFEETYGNLPRTFQYNADSSVA